MEADTLLAKYFGGNATEQELLQLEEWIATSPENEVEFMRMTKLYELAGTPENARLEINIEAAKQQFNDYRAKSNENKHVQFRPANNKRSWLVGRAFDAGYNAILAKTGYKPDCAYSAARTSENTTRRCYNCVFIGR
jgi:ferric-dicitrate binding protein FerR (iron transport regulator)